MKWSEWLDQWTIVKLKLTAGFLNLEFEPNDHDKMAAWELYVELLTRIATQPLPDGQGEENSALKSIYSLFEISRDLLKRHGRHGREFTKLSIVVLNQIIRPFTAKWHILSRGNCFEDTARREEFRRELANLQAKLREYARMLAKLAEVPDLTSIEPADQA
jgi:hypothetical protein